MHGITTKRKGHEYRYFTCSAKCGAPVVHMDDVEDAAKAYLKTLLSGENQLRIADAMRAYQAGKSSRMEEFKQAQYDALMQNLASGSLPAEVVADIGTRMKDLKEEIGPRNRPKISRPT